MKNSLKQLLRTPMKTALFFLLMTAATALLVLGANLWAQTQAKIDAAEGLFVSLGTVEQLPDYEAPVKTKTLDSLWLGAEETESVYGTVYDESVLDFPGAAYVHGPEKRTHLQLTFDDNGYSEVVGGLENLRTAAIILFAAGLLSALSILVLLLYFFIVKQKKRTAIERSLGMSKNQCRVSLVSGVVVLSAVAVILGTVCSSVLFDKVQTLDLTGQSEHTFSTEYSLWARDENAVETEDAENTGVLEVVIPAAMILLTAGLSVILVNRSLKYELIEMLNK